MYNLVYLNGQIKKKNGVTPYSTFQTVDTRNLNKYMTVNNFRLISLEIGLLQSLCIHICLSIMEKM